MILAVICLDVALVLTDSDADESMANMKLARSGRCPERMRHMSR